MPTEPEPRDPAPTGHQSGAGTRWLAAMVADAIAITLFVLAGRSSHAEAASLAGFARTAWPFAAGALVGWLASRGWRRPLEVAPTGLLVWVAAVAVGMLLRVVSGQGIAATFVLVAAVVLGILLLGWRALVDSISWLRGLLRRGPQGRAQTRSASRRSDRGRL
jgi:peptidoglycan/LPS O-acetylase OafA/YrhL